MPNPNFTLSTAQYLARFRLEAPDGKKYEYCPPIPTKRRTDLKWNLKVPGLDESIFTAAEKCASKWNEKDAAKLMKSWAFEISYLAEIAPLTRLRPPEAGALAAPSAAALTAFFMSEARLLRLKDTNTVIVHPPIEILWPMCGWTYAWASYLCMTEWPTPLYPRGDGIGEMARTLFRNTKPGLEKLRAELVRNCPQEKRLLLEQVNVPPSERPVVTDGMMITPDDLARAPEIVGGLSSAVYINKTGSDC